MSHIAEIRDHFDEKGVDVFELDQFLLGSDNYSPPLKAPYVFAEQQLDRFYHEGARRVLDLGCGTGIHAVNMAKKGFQVTAIDCSPQSLAAAKRLAEYHELDGQIQFHEGDAIQWMQHEKAEFDLVFTSGVLYYLDRDALVETLNRSLVPGGRLLCVETYGGNPMMAAMRKLRRVHDAQTLNHLLGMKEIRDLSRRFAQSETVFFNFLDLGALLLKFAPPIQSLALTCARPVDRVLLNTLSLRFLAWKYVFVGVV